MAVCVGGGGSEIGNECTTTGGTSKSQSLLSHSAGSLDDNFVVS